MRRNAGALVAALAASLVAGAACAEVPADAAARLAAAVRAPQSRMGPASGAVLAVPARRDAPVRIPGVAKTAVETTLDEAGATAAAGFLCGLQPGADRYGAGAAHGYDPTGRFVGAKLSFAFR